MALKHRNARAEMRGFGARAVMNKHRDQRTEVPVVPKADGVRLLCGGCRRVIFDAGPLCFRCKTAAAAAAISRVKEDELERTLSEAGEWDRLAEVRAQAGGVGT